MSQLARPVVVISRCIDFDACRYNGQVIRASLREELEPHIDFEPICPELEIGLGVPRDPIRIIARDGGRLVQPSTGRDLTDAMRSFSDSYLTGIGDVDGFILKSRSPSCAVTDARLHVNENADQSTGNRPGMFAERVVERFPFAAIEDEAGLNDPRIRDHFLTRVFAFAAFREAAADGALEALVDFHAGNERLLLAHDPDALPGMGRIVANDDRLSPQRAAEHYREALAAALSRPAPAPYPVRYPKQLVR